jgi:hypothetical protein
MSKITFSKFFLSFSLNFNIEKPREIFLNTELIGHYSSEKAKDEYECWDFCDNELVCNAVSFSKNKVDENDKNCYLFASLDAKKELDVEFISILRRSLGK